MNQTLATAAGLAEVYMEMRAGTLSIATPAVMRRFALALVKESLAT